MDGPFVLVCAVPYTHHSRLGGWKNNVGILWYTLVWPAWEGILFCLVFSTVSCRRQSHLYLNEPFGRSPKCDSAVVEFHNAFDDGQPQPYATWFLFP